MKKIFFISIQIAVLLSNNLDFFSLSKEEKDTPSGHNQNSTYISLKYPAYSFIVPGLGEYALYKDTEDKRYRNMAASFFAVEVISHLSSILNKDRYDDQKKKYKRYANQNWNFSDWIYHYDDFENTNYESIWFDSDDIYTHIGQSSHYVQFYMGSSNNLIKTTDEDFLNVYYSLFLEDIENNIDIYDKYDIRIFKDQHFYENIGKYNEFFSGWEDADTSNIIVEATGQNYNIALSPIKNKYINSYKKAESYYDIAEFSTNCIFFNHFISMLDAFVLPQILRKFDMEKSDKVMIHSSTIYSQKKIQTPIGVKVDLIIKL